MKKLLLFILLSSWAFGQLAAPTLIDSVRFAAGAQAGRLHIRSIDATNYLLAWYSAASKVTLRTFTIDGAYDITDNGETEDMGNGNNPYLLKLDTNKFLLTWEYGTNVNIKTLTLAKPAAYTFTTIDSVSLYAVTNNYGAIKHLTGNYYVGATRNTPSTQAEVFTFSMDGAYDNITYIDHLVHDTNEGKTPDIVVIDATHFIVTYGGSGDDGYVATFSVDASADNITELYEREFEPTYAIWHNLEQIDATHYLNVYRNQNTDAMAVVFTLDGSYNATTTDSVKIEIVGGNYASMAKLTNNIYAINGRDNATDQHIQSLSIDGSYEITGNDMYEHDLNATYSEICRIDDTHAIVAYADLDDTNIVVKTFEFPGATGWAHTINGVLSPTKVSGVEPPTSVSGVE